MKKTFFILIVCLGAVLFAQDDKVKKIHYIHSDVLKATPEKFDGNPFAYGKVEFEHDGARLYSDSAVFYQKENFFRAWSNVKMLDDGKTLIADSIEYDGNTSIAKAFDNVHIIDSNKSELFADYADYNRETEVAKAMGNVILQDPSQRIETEELTYNQKTGIAETHVGATIFSKDGTKTYTSSLVYNMNTKESIFDENVSVETKDYRIKSERMIMNEQTKITEFLGYTVMSSRSNPRDYIVTTKGKFNDNTKEAFLYNRSTIYKEGRELWGDEMYFNDNTGYGWAKGDVLIDEPEEKRYIKGEFAEVFRDLDSAYVTGRAYAVKVFAEDSLYFHADTIMATQSLDSTRVLRGYFNAKFFKSNAQGKADSISFNETTGVMQFFRDPVMWTGEQQVTGDTIISYNNIKLEIMDSIRVYPNAFAISRVDSLTLVDFNQVKGRTMLGLFLNNDLDWIEVEGNAQALNFIDEENKETKEKDRVGINISNCGIIEADVNNRDLEVLSCRIQAMSKLHPESKLEENQKYLKDFAWRENERPKKWKDIFLTTEEIKKLSAPPEEIKKEIQKKE